MEQSAAVRTTEFYRSPIGDRWLLDRGPETSRVFVRHEPNLPSGGQVVDIETGAFLRRNCWPLVIAERNMTLG
jgi:hypothetical protein